MASKGKFSGGLEALAAAQSAPDVSRFGRKLENIGNRATEAVANKAASGFWNSAGSGFGKGALITAALFVIGTALGVGSLAYADFVANGTGTLVPGMTNEFVVKMSDMSFTQGLWEGAKMGVVGLGNMFGVTAMFAGGMLGAVAEARDHQNKLEAEIAEERARSREALRGIEQMRSHEVGTTQPQQAQQQAPAQASAHVNIETTTQPVQLAQHTVQQDTPEEATVRFRDKFKPRCVEGMEDISYSTRELDRKGEPGTRGVA